MKRYHRIHTSYPPVPIWSKFELGVATECVRALPKRAVYLEIGSYRGGTLWHFANHGNLNPGATIISVDLPGSGMIADKNTRQTLERIGEEIQGKGFDVHLVNGKSLESIEEVDAILAGRKANVLLIDGDHGPGAALADWVAYSPRLDGIAIFHDCGIPDGSHELTPAEMRNMTNCRAGFLTAAVGHRFLHAQGDFGTGIVWT